MTIDGRAIAAEILAKVKADLAPLGRTPVVRAIAIEPTKVTESYLAAKAARAADAGMELQVTRFEASITAQEIIAEIQRPGADAVIVQLPLPAHFDTTTILDAIPAHLDADVLSAVSYDQFAAGSLEALMPPVTSAIREVLMHADVSLIGKRVVVIGEGKLVGKPTIAWLDRIGVSLLVINENTTDTSAIGDADVIISAAGVPRLITPDRIKAGVVLIDAGTSESNGAVVGDIDPACAELASVFTPVPGGIGPVAVACLFRNVAELVLGNPSTGG